jgi:hypothetical protein
MSLGGKIGKDEQDKREHLKEKGGKRKDKGITQVKRIK